MNMIDPSETRLFFEVAFGRLPAGQQILVWTLPDKVSRFAATQEIAATYAVKRAEQADVYVGTGTRRRDLGARTRGGTAAVCGLAGFWADLDIAHAVHKKRNLPPDLDAALALLGELPLAPTLTVDSGHGLQAWWLFETPALLEDHAERERAEALSAGWSDLLRRRAAAHGWEVDSVWDLARVLRVPGTVNHKQEPVPVRLLDADGPRYAEPEAFAPYVTVRSGVRQAPLRSPLVAASGPPHRNGVRPEAGAATGTGEGAGAGAGADAATGSDAGGLTFDPHAEPPFSKWLALRDNDLKFRQTWERKRRDLQDQSSSGYHMALASQAAACDWTDQEIVNLCIAWQRLHVEDLAKVLRPDYWLGSPTRLGTLAKARQPLEQERAAAQLAGEGDDTPSAEDTPALLAATSRLLGVEVAAVIQHGRQRARYSLRLADGREVAIGPTTAVLSLDQFRARLFEQAGVTLPVYKKERWLRIAATLAHAATLEENPEATREFATREWIAGYLASTTVVRDGANAEEYGEAIAAGRPFVREGVLHLHAPSLRRYVLLTALEQIDAADLHDALRALGFRQRPRFGRTRAGKPRRKSYWHGPARLIEEGEGPETTETPETTAARGDVSGPEESVETTLHPVFSGS